MPSAGTAYLDVKGDFSPFHRQLRTETSRTNKASRTLGRAASLGLAAGFAGAAVVIKKSFDELRQAQKAGAQTRAVLKSTGGAAQVSARHVEDLAEKLSLVAGVDDELIQASENVLLTFTKVRNETGKGNRIFDQATVAITDMSAALKQDLQSSTIQVGKALQDPIKGMTALRRVGVAFTQEQQERVAGWVEEGQLLRAQKFILKELTTEFAGSARAQADGFDRIKVAVDNLFESLGKTAGPAVEKFAGKAAKFIEQMRIGEGAGGRFADQMKRIGEAVLPVVRTVGRAAGAIGKFAANHPQITTIATSAGLIAAAFAKFKVGKGLAALIGLGTGKGLGGGVLSKASPVPVFVTNPGFAGGGKGRPGGPVVAPGPGSRVPVPSAPKTPFSRLPSGVKTGVGVTAGGLAALKISSDFFKDQSDLGLMEKFADQLERVARAGDKEGMRKLAKDLRETASANQDLTSGPHLKAFADELDRTASKGGKDISGLTRLFKNLPKTTGSSLPQVGKALTAMAGRTDHAEARTSSLAGTFEKGRGKSQRYSDSVARLGDKIRSLPTMQRVDIELFLTRRGPANLTDEGFPRPRRTGGLVLRGGGMVPAMLSPGEVGVDPSGASFKVPGQRTAGDTVPMMLRQGTAVLTTSGQRMMQRGASLMDAIRNQLPHFQKGGVVKAAAAAKTAGFRGRHLVNMLAIAGRESSWNPRAANYKYPDHSIGLWQINQLAHKGRFGSDSQLMDRVTNAKAAKSLFDQSGYQPWVSVAYGNATQYLDEARAAVAALEGKGGGGVKVTPSPITRPLLGTQLQALAGDGVLGGLQRGREGTGRRDLLAEILEGIVPESGDRATRERISGGGGAKASGPIAARVKKMQDWALSVARKNMPYQYGGGHGTIGVGSPSFDCSGYASGIAHAGGLLNSPLTTVGFQGWGLPGEGRNVTFGVRGGAGMSGHMMTKVDDMFFESGGGHGPAKVGGWNGTFTTQRHPSFRKGGMAGMLPPSKEGRKHLEKLARRKRVPVEQLLDPKSKDFVGFGLRGGGFAGVDPTRKFFKSVWKQTKRIGGKGFSERMPAIIRNAGNLGGNLGQFVSDGRQVQLPTGFIRALQGRPNDLFAEMVDADGNPIDSRGVEMSQVMKTLIHEYAHSAQPINKMKRWEREGGAEAFAQWAAPQVYRALGLPYMGAGTSYPNFVGQVRKNRSPHWVQHGQFQGMRAGGVVGMRKPPTLEEIIRQLGGEPGTPKAQKLTKTLASRLKGRSTGALVKSQTQIRKQIKRMAKKGFTGPERIQTRRLRGALGLVQDELGRPIGRQLGASDRLQELIDRRQSRLPDELTVLGVDPDSKQGLGAQRDVASQSLFRLTQRRGELNKALKRARKSGDKGAVREVQAEIREVDDQTLALRASIVNLDNTMKQVEVDRIAEALEALAERERERAEAEREKTAQLRRNEQLITSQGPALIAGLQLIVNGGIGGQAGLGRSFPSFAGLGGLART